MAPTSGLVSLREVVHPLAEVLVWLSSLSILDVSLTSRTEPETQCKAMGGHYYIL